MGFLGMLMAVATVLIVVMGMDPTSPWTWAVTLGTGFCVAFGVYLLVAHGMAWLMRNWMAQREFLMDGRRRIAGAKSTRSRAEERLEQMDEAALRAHLERKPKDALAVEILAERLDKAGRHAEYAQEIEYLLTIPNRLSKEEQCNLLNRLADQYLGPLQQPAKGRRALQMLLAQFPTHYQATLARRRLAQLDGVVDGGANLEDYRPEDFLPPDLNARR